MQLPPCLAVHAWCLSLIGRTAFQTALLHLKPAPKSSCQTLSPLFNPWYVSTWASAYLRHTHAHCWWRRSIQLQSELHSKDAGEWAVDACTSSVSIKFTVLSTHHVEAAETLPKWYSVSKEGCTSSCARPSLFPISFITPLPPALSRVS